ncbi:MAG: (deoxy)nucleoside triphosphate pyrophosphohydrolase [Candidatus Acidiferrales bacterium]
MLTVVAAIIVDDGKVLICQRSRTDSFPLKWEFPGGKVEPGETPAQALAREVLEELGAPAIIGTEFLRVRHKYPEKKEPIQLIFLWTQMEAGSERNLQFEQLLWAAPGELKSFDFLEADWEVVRRLAVELSGADSATPRIRTE